MATKTKILALDHFCEQIKTWQKAGEKVVFTNGCFDIVHLGHVDYLEKAREKGDRLVVALNTDASVSRIKGPKRPIVNEYARARVMASLAFVDAVTFFDEETPLELISACLPDVLVKGDDYTVDTIVGAKEVMANGGKVETISLVEGFSTSNIIKKINEAYK